MTGVRAKLMPALFVGHGNPMNAVLDNSYTEAWRALGADLPVPRAIVAISAHWCIAGTSVTLAMSPKTIHDFGGFPDELYEVQYPALGYPALARELQQLLAPVEVKLDDRWGLDHGTWSVLRHLYPLANIPVVQLSIDATQPASFHIEIGRKLAPLRDDGVLILGSGNVVHNMRAYSWGIEAGPYDWATRFEDTVKKLLSAGEYQRLVEYDTLGTDAVLSIPTPEHYLPLLYVLGAQQPGEALTFPAEGIVGGSTSMLTVRMG